MGGKAQVTTGLQFVEKQNETKSQSPYCLIYSKSETLKNGPAVLLQ